MFLNIRLFLAAFIISSVTFAQEVETKKNTETETQQESSGKEVGSIVVGPYFPISFGGNFVNDGMNLKPGIRFSFKVNAYQGFYIGPYFSYFNGKVLNTELIGNYYKTRNIVIGGVMGYEKHLDKFDVSIGIGVGEAIFYNKASFDNFTDTATAVWLNPEVSYRFSPYFGVYFSPELRHDFMNIDVPAELNDTFKGVNYLNLSFGLRFNLGSAYKAM